MSAVMKFSVVCLAATLAYAPWAGLLAQTGNDDDSAPHSTDSETESDSSAGDDDSAGAAAPEPTNSAPTGSPATKKEVCDDDVDNDGDNLIDCADLNDCAAFRTCGQIQGGWGWVISAYGLSFAALLGYTLMVTLRLRALQQRGDS